MSPSNSGPAALRVHGGVHQHHALPDLVTTNLHVGREEVHQRYITTLMHMVAVFVACTTLTVSTVLLLY